MREHQIIITLKPEQFLEVQRLSKAAGSKSMGMFVRQKLLSSLGIDAAAGSSAANVAESASVDALKFKRVLTDLKRVHGELKSFVAESLSKTYIEDSSLPVTDDSGTSQAPSPDTVLPPGSSGQDALLPFDMEEVIRDFAEVKEDLEQLAQRAFVISPKLGSLQKPADPAALKKGVDDPLEELLEDPLMKKYESYVAKSNMDNDSPEDEELIDVTISRTPDVPRRVPPSAPAGNTTSPAQRGQSLPAPGPTPGSFSQAPASKPSNSDSGPTAPPFSGNLPPKKRRS